MTQQRCVRSISITVLLALLAVMPARSTPGPVLPHHITTTDSVYSAHHPCLLFTQSELPDLRAKARDGGADDTAYDFIRIFVDLIYPTSSNEELLGNDFGLGTVPNLGLATYLEEPPDTVAETIGRNLTLYLANQYDVDRNAYNSSLRLRALALGYDMFFARATVAERELVKNEIVAYIDSMTTRSAFTIYKLRPYLSNQSAMIASALGLAAISLDGEIGQQRVNAALELADNLTHSWFNYLLDERGAYNEGLLYGAWSMRHFIYYFHALKRYGGTNYAENGKIRSMEQWFVYELLPEGNSRTNNLNDCAYSDWALSKHNTYFEWAMSEWNSGLSSWIWEHTSGQYGYDYGIKSDKASTVLWHRDIAPVQPDSILPGSMLWEERGLYYFRTGWQSGLSSNDVLFSFYSGTFEGGHAQEDQNNFTLNAYGGKFVLDHGIGTPAKDSEGHNLVFIDGKGQHNAGNSIGTDGSITQFLLGGFADYIVGDATSAYTTYSYYNRWGYPIPGTDWSWGYDGGNPVDHAIRTVLVMHGDTRPPYFIILDDVEKDGAVHEYAWRLHTYYSYAIDTTANPIRVTDSARYMNIHVLNPPRETVRAGIEYFNNVNNDPDSRIISLTTDAVNPHFIVLLFPGDDTVTPPAVTQEYYPWGIVCTVDFGDGNLDTFIYNESGGTISLPDTPGAQRRAVTEGAVPATTPAFASLQSDAELAVIRTENGLFKDYIVTNATALTCNDTLLVHSANGPLSAARSGATIQIDRFDADFTFYAPGVSAVYYQGQRIFVNMDGGYLTPDPVTGINDARPVQPFLTAAAYPNPFNPATTIRVWLRERALVRVTIHDALGRTVSRLWNGPLAAGVQAIEWDGTNNAGTAVSSGIYFARIVAGDATSTVKLSLIK